MAQLDCSLSTAIDLPATFTWSKVERTIILIFVPLVTFIGNIGNLSFLYTGLRVPRMRTVANMYLFSLAVSDVLLLSSVCLAYLWIFATTPVIRNQAYNSAIWCWFIIYPSSVCYYASIQMVTLVSFERYYAICQPLKHRSFAGKQRTKNQIAGCWLIAAVFAVVVTFKVGDIQSVSLCVRSIAGGPSVEPYILTLSYCKNPFAFVWFSLISEIMNDVLFLAALISSSITYVKIIQVLTKREETSLQASQNNTTNNVRKQVAIILIINGIIFFICQIPYRFYDFQSITALFKVWSLSEYQMDKLETVFRISLYVNSAVNPYIYIVGSTFYRQAFMEAFRFKRSTPATAKSISSSAVTQATQM